jgi:hypothetical protein
VGLQRLGRGRQYLYRDSRGSGTSRHHLPQECHPGELGRARLYSGFDLPGRHVLDLLRLTFPQRPGRLALVQDDPCAAWKPGETIPLSAGRTFQIVRLRHDANPPQLGKVVRQERAAETLKASQSQG